MDNQNNYLDPYEEYEHIAERMVMRGRAKQKHRASRHRQNHKEKVTRREIIDSVTAENDLLIDFKPTYLQNFDPKHLEYGWIMDSLGGFYRDKVIADVLKNVKAGKEANVYSCTGTAATGHELIAAKLYRPRMLRHLRNDAIYKEGRFTRGQDGKEDRRSRTARALKKKTSFGQQVDFASWITHEFSMQKQLYAAGADVPEPIAQRDNVILMAFIGDETRAAPTLIDTSLTAEEAPALFERIMQNVELMLAHNYVHGDLSAYNILYWDGRVTIIDFPQLADARVNSNAFPLLERDIRRVCEYFANYNVPSDPVALTTDLWQDYLDGRL